MKKSVIFLLIIMCGSSAYARMQEGVKCHGENGDVSFVYESRKAHARGTFIVTRSNFRPTEYTIIGKLVRYQGSDERGYFAADLLSKSNNLKVSFTRGTNRREGVIELGNGLDLSKSFSYPFTCEN